MINLKDLEHFRSDPRVQFKEEVVGGITVVIPHYMIADSDFWKLPLATELRGNVFLKDTGECISRGFDKFFNINENEENQEHNIDFTQPFDCLEKRDGSMITGVLINGKVYLKTKKSFYSDVAILANKLMTEDVRFLFECALEIGFSPIMEFTHPDWKIVVDYGNEATWTLLAIRNINSGKYNTHKELVYHYNIFNVPIIKRFEYYTLYDIKNSIATMKDEEGYVIAFNDGRRVKIKCEWYNLRHHINTDLRERDVARMCMDETFHDIKPAIIEAGHDINIALAIESRFASEISNIIEETKLLSEKFNECLDKKEIAQKYKSEKYFTLAVKYFEGRDINYIEYWYRQGYLSNYSLRTIYSEFNHNSEEV